MRWTYGDLEREATATRRRPRRPRGRALHAGRPIVMGNRPEMVASIFGIALAGGVAVPLSTFSTTSELARPARHRSAVAGVLTQSAPARRAPSPRTWTGLVAEADTSRSSVGAPRSAIRAGPSCWSDGAGHVTAVERRGRARSRPAIPASSCSAPAPRARRRACSTSTGRPTLQFWLQADIFRPHDRGPGVGTAADVLDGRSHHRDGVHPRRRRLLRCCRRCSTPATHSQLLARERVTEPYTLPHQASALAEHPDWSATDLSSLREVFGKSVFTRHPSVHGDTTWNMPVGYGMLRDLRDRRQPPVETPPRDEMKASTGRLLPGVRLRVARPRHRRRCSAPTRTASWPSPAPP